MGIIAPPISATSRISIGGTQIALGTALALVGQPRPANVASRAGYHNTSGGLSDGANTWQNTRWVQNMGPYTATDLQLIFSNAQARATTGDQAGNAPITVTASIEYPSSTFTQALFNGAASVTIPATPINPGIVSDPIPVEIPAGAQYWVRINVSVGTLGQKWPLSRNSGQGVGALDGLTQGTGTNSDLTLTGTISGGNSTNGYLCDAILARTAAPRIVPLISGDSIAYSVNGTVDATGRRGWLERALVDAFGGVINQSIAGDTIAAIGNPAITNYRAGVFPKLGATHVLCEAGTNDLGAASLAALQALFLTYWRRYSSRGMKVYQTTLLPKSTDATSATPGTNAGPNSLRTQINDWIRTVPAPLSGYIEVADTVEAATPGGPLTRNGGYWYAASATTDGLHPTVATEALMIVPVQAAVAKWSL